MTRIQIGGLLAIAFLLAVGGGLWFARPTPIDMASYAPADSLLYLESNNPLKVVDAVAGTEAWAALAGPAAFPNKPSTSSVTGRFIYWTGIGPVESVILARSQVAVVLLEMGTAEDSGSLTIKPEGALIIETHTMESRIRAPVERSLQRIAEGAYGQPVVSRVNVDGVELMEWSAPAKSRQLVATIQGSLVIVGNSRQVVQKCLATARGQSASLKQDAELHRAREHAGSDALTFGYVPKANSAKLLSVTIPLLLGRAPGDADFQRVVMTGASKILGGLAWSSRPYRGGIEDRYSISLQPEILGQLKPGFGVPDSSVNQKLLSKNFELASFYRFAKPAETWQVVKTSVSAHVDTLSAVLFATLLKSSLLSYGVKEPEAFLSQINGPILTARLDQTGERFLLIAHPLDRTALREALITTLGFRPLGSSNELEDFVDSDGEINVRLTDNLIVFGSRDDVQKYFESISVSDEAAVKRMLAYAPTSTSNVVTYTNDSERLRNFVLAVAAITRSSVRDPLRVDQVIIGMPYSSTESTLSNDGVERVTRSPLGQFSTLLPLVVPEQQTQTPPSR